jgi:bleomycin hydrolase
VDAPEYPVIEEMEERNKTLREEAAAKTDEILAEQRAAAEQREEAKQKLRFDMEHIVRPAGPDGFTTRLWHFPPTPQYLTGACWSFATTSFLESDIQRRTGREVKLSEMWSVYWEFVAKARGYVASRGETIFEHGSQSAAVMRVVREHGLVPRSAYEGVIAEDGRFDHSQVHEAMQEFLLWCKAKDFWDEDMVLAMIRTMLDRTMGRPPDLFEWQGEVYTPGEFRDRVCAVDADDYVELMSTLAQPMWQRGEYRVPDNWWHGKEYLNVPLDVWYAAILEAVAAGHTLAIGGDVSEPGLNGFEDMAVIPSFDIPFQHIDQDARELRFDNGSTGDDHGVHLVGHTRLDGHDWFLVKDSNRSSRQGKYEGYYMYRDDYVKLKMLTFMVHRDAVPGIVERVAAEGPAED